MCVKWVAAEGELRVDPTTRAVDASRATRKISDYDRNTIEAARLAAAQLGGELVGLTFGTPDAKATLKDVLARGADSAVHVVADDGARADGHVTAHVLAAQIARTGDVDLVLCTEGASDTYAHETGPRVGELLGWPVITNVRELTVDGRTLHAVRIVGTDLETVECDLPAVVTVVPEIAAAPIPGLRSVLGANKKPSQQVPVTELGLPAGDLEPRTNVTSFLGYVAARRRTVLADGDAQHTVDALVAGLAQDGVL